MLKNFATSLSLVVVLQSAYVPPRGRGPSAIRRRQCRRRPQHGSAEAAVGFRQPLGERARFPGGPRAHVGLSIGTLVAFTDGYLVNERLGPGQLAPFLRLELGYRHESQPRDYE
jgi:hypothetical protein